MRFNSSLLVAASVLLTVHANDKNWHLPKEAGAVAARAAVARAIQSPVSDTMNTQGLSQYIRCDFHADTPD
jgi:hypothetical protein